MQLVIFMKISNYVIILPVIVIHKLNIRGFFMTNKQKMRKRRRALLCVFAAFAFSFNPLGKIAYATPKQNTSIVNQIQTQEETSNSIQNQPISSYWYPEDLLKWSANNDKDAQFNKSTVPLAKESKKINLTLLMILKIKMLKL